jgi:hypothetical protein
LTWWRTAAIEGLRALKAPSRVTVYADSAYLANGMEQRWYDKWRVNGWRNSQRQPVANQELWEELADLADNRGHQVRFEKVNGHADRTKGHVSSEHERLNQNTPNGREAVKRFALPPFVDGSCRREPDFESEFPSISGLCRKAKFAPRLHVGDTAIYVTTKGGWGRRLVAVLRVRERFDSHAEAAEWYRELGLALPGNPLYRELHDPPQVSDNMLIEALDRVPGTQNPPQVTEEQALRLLELVGVAL